MPWLLSNDPATVTGFCCCLWPHLIPDLETPFQNAGCELPLLQEEPAPVSLASAHRESPPGPRPSHEYCRCVEGRAHSSQLRARSVLRTGGTPRRLQPTQPRFDSSSLPELSDSPGKNVPRTAFFTKLARTRGILRATGLYSRCGALNVLK